MTIIENLLSYPKDKICTIMSEEIRRKYFIKEIDKDNNIISQKEYESSKDFYKDFKKNNKKVVATTSIDNGLENPVYFIRSKVVFSEGNSTLCISNRGKLQEENKYEILKGKDGKDKYVVKKDENSYYRYSTNGHLIDSIKKVSGNERTNNYIYNAYESTSKKKINTKITSANIDEAIELSRGQIKIEKKGLEDEYKIEEEFFDITGIYPNGNTFVKGNDFFAKHYKFVKDLCIKNDAIKENDETYYGIGGLIVKLASEIAGHKENLKLSDLSKAKSLILKELFREYNHKVFALNAKGKKNEKEITRENKNNISEKVEFAFFDKEKNEKDDFLTTDTDSMRFFDEKNILGVDNKTNRITIGGNTIDNKEEYMYYFVKPVGQPMYLFKKEMGGEFSNHSNFELKEGESREVEAAGSIKIKDGKICNISNSSGHFKPGSESIKTALTYIASKTKNCKIENLIHQDRKMENGDFKILTNVEDAVELSKEVKKHFSECIEDERVVKNLTRDSITAINIKATRMKAKESSKGRSIC